MKRSRVTEIRMHPFEARSPRRFSRNSGSVACICRRMMLFPLAPQPRSPMNKRRRSSQGGAGVAVAAPRVDGVMPAVVVDTDRERLRIRDTANQRRVGIRLRLRNVVRVSCNLVAVHALRRQILWVFTRHAE